MKFTARRGDDAALIGALARGATHQEAAARAGVSPRTLRRRLEDPAFSAEVERARAATLQAVNDGLRELAGRVTRVLGELLEDPTPPAVKLGAARTVLDQLFRYQEAVGFQNQLDQLENRVALAERGEVVEADRW